MLPPIRFLKITIKFITSTRNKNNPTAATNVTQNFPNSKYQDILCEFTMLPM